MKSGRDDRCFDGTAAARCRDWVPRWPAPPCSVVRPARAALAVGNPTPPDYPIEDGAKLRVLRPSKFVQGDEDLFNANSKKFTDQTGVPVTVDNQSWEDLRPLTSVSANVGSGPDVVLAWQEDPQLFAGKLLVLDDLAAYLGEKYGGWFPVAEHYGKNAATGEWVALPIGGGGATMVYRQGWLKEAGYDSVPGDFPGFLELCKALSRAVIRPASRSDTRSAMPAGPTGCSGATAPR